MEVIDTEIIDLKLIQPKYFKDSRGYFVESFKEDFIKKNFPDLQFIQDNESKSSFGVLRGLHFQKPPYEQTKLVRVVYGKVLDVAVDLRIGSPSFGMHKSFTLSDENGLQLLIPKGFAHGFLVLSETAIFQYKVDETYKKEFEDRISFDDCTLDIDWKLPKSSIILSERDRIKKTFIQYKEGSEVFKY